MFDLKNTEIKDDFAPIDTGWYGAHVEKLEWKTSAAGAEYLNAQFKLDNGRVVFSMYHVMNANEQARNIALSSVKKALLASGFKEDKLSFTSKEHLTEAMAMVNCEIYLTIKRDEQYGDKNEVKNYRPREEKKAEVDTSNMPF